MARAAHILERLLPHPLRRGDAAAWLNRLDAEMEAMGRRVDGDCRASWCEVFRQWNRSFLDELAAAQRRRARRAAAATPTTKTEPGDGAGNVDD
jgi:hypothetical protein